MKGIELKTIEKLLFRFFTAIFNSGAKNVSYTFGVAFSSSLGGFLIAAYIALFLASTLRFDPPL